MQFNKNYSKWESYSQYLHNRRYRTYLQKQHFLQTSSFRAILKLY
jgi:hypothetical protein